MMPVVMLQSMPEALPENAPAEVVELAPSASPAAAAPMDQGMDMLQLILHASIPVQLVMVLLLLA